MKEGKPKDTRHKDYCIVSLGTRPGDLRGQQRLEASLKKYWKGGYMLFQHEAEVGAPLHKDNPYAFKYYSISKAEQTLWAKFNRVYTPRKIIWVDSSVYLIKEPTELIEILDRDGYIMQEAGHMVGNWCNDTGLEYFGITRDEALKMPMYGNAGLLGLDLTVRRDDTAAPLDFKLRWYQAMRAGIFKGSHTDHRHDMTCGSIIANQLGMKYNIKGDEILAYAAPKEAVGPQFCMKAEGILANSPINFE